MLNFWETLRHAVLERFIKKKIVSNVPRKLMPVGKAEKIGILFQADNAADGDIIVEYAETLKKEGKDVQILGFLSNRNHSKNYLFPYISPKDITWFGKPKGGTSGFFIKYPFDILINFAPKEIVPFEYIFTLSRAGCRIGFNEKNTLDPYDCILLAKNKNDIRGMIQALDQYLF